MDMIVVFNAVIGVPCVSIYLGVRWRDTEKAQGRVLQPPQVTRCSWIEAGELDHSSHLRNFGHHARNYRNTVRGG